MLRTSYLLKAVSKTHSHASNSNFKIQNTFVYKLYDLTCDNKVTNQCNPRYLILISDNEM